MARNKGGIVLVDNYEVKLEGALDPRVAVASKGDLIVRDTWPNDGGDPYLYDGLIVGVKDEKAVYMLVDKSKALYEDYSGWVRVDAGGVKIDNIFTYKSSVASYDALPVVNAVGDVYNVETRFTLNDKEYPAGTNVAWNGTTWDPLAGSVDLSAYATTASVAEVRASAATNAEAIQELGEALGEANAAIAEKVDKVEGYSLVSQDEKDQIALNATDIQSLQELDIDQRLSTLESAFKGEGGTIDLSDINESIKTQGAAITELQSSKADASKVTTLEETVAGLNATLNEAVGVNTTQGTQIASLSEQVNALETKHTNELIAVNQTLATHGTGINTLTTDLNSVSTRVATIESDYLTAAAIEGKLDKEVYNVKIAALEKADADNLASAKVYAEEQAGAVNASLQAEITRAKAAEAANTALIEANAAAIEVEKGRLDAILTGEGVSEALDSFKELQAWISEHGEEADAILEVATAAEAAAKTAQQEVDTLEEAVSALETTLSEGDAATLVSANAYTDQKIGELGSAAKMDADYFASALALADVKTIAENAATKADTYTRAEVDAAISNAFRWNDVTVEE